MGHRGIFVVAAVVVAVTWESVAEAQPAVTEAQPAEAQPVVDGHGEGTVELRLQTASTIAGGGIFGLATTPGLTYATDSDLLIINLLGGAGYFINPSFALGGDAGVMLIDGDAEAIIVTLAPFAKFVTGLPERQMGFFLEASPGILIVDGAGGESSTFTQLSAWLGGHFPVGRSAGFLVGPYVTRVDDTEAFGDGEFIIGIRFGMSVYL